MAGNVPYTKTDWHDHIVDITTGDVIQEGTRFTAQRANNMEDGIYRAHERLDAHDNEILRLRVQMELDGRVPGNSGAYFDDFIGTPNKLVRQSARADIITHVVAGATVLSVDSVVGFVAFTQVTVFDGTNSEDVLITAIGADTITVQALTHDYVKGARIARSNAKIADGQMINGDWGTYTISAEVV